MAIEIELKFAASPRALRDASRLPWLRKLANGKASSKELVSVYFDTPKCKLRDNDLSLRIRRVGNKTIQTIKTTANGASGGVGRDEWEDEVKSQAPDLKLARRTALAPLVTDKLKRSLRPVFETAVQRTALPLRVGASDIEIAFDRGYIKAGAARARISEIELELKKGVPADLAQLAERLVHAIPLAYGARTKSERGYALNAGSQAAPVAAAPLALHYAVSTGEAFAVIGLSCLHHLAANEDAVRAGEAEGVHQMRVGLRRLRAALALFKEIGQGTQLERLKADLKWLTAQLGPARDFDVLVTESVVPLRKATPDKTELKLLQEDLEEKRHAGFDKAKAAVASARYRDLVLAAALWFINGEWRQDTDAPVAARRAQPARAFAKEILRRRTAKIVKRAARLETLSPRDRHRLRIAVKKLRYAADFFAGLFAKPKARKAHKHFKKCLKALQHALGKLNDIAVHEKMAKQLTRSAKRSRKSAEKAFAMGVLTGREQSRARACLAAAVKAGEDLSDARPFWR